MNHLEIRVMTHPTRRRLAEQVLSDLNYEYAEIIVDPDPWGPVSTLRTAVTAWDSMDRQHGSCLLLQDDVEVSPELLHRAKAIAATHPQVPVAFHTDWASRNGAVVRYGMATGLSLVWAVPEYIPCQAIMLPSSLAASFVRFCRNNTEPGWQNAPADDDALRLFFAATNTPLLLSVPNLVQHKDVASSAGNSAHGRRRASAYIGDLLSPPSFDPTSTVPLPTALPYLRDSKLYVYRPMPNANPSTGSMHWTKTPFEHSSGNFQTSLATLTDMYNVELERRSAETAETLFSELSSRTLWSIWAAAWLFARVELTIPGPGSELVLKERDKDLLLATMVYGGIGRSVLDRSAPAVLEFAKDAFHTK